MQMEILSYAGFGPIHFGMNREAVRALFGESPRAFRRAAQGPPDSEQFAAAGLVVTFDGADKCIFVQAVKRACPTFRRKQLVGIPYHDIASWFREIDPDIEENAAGLVSRLHGVALYAPSAKRDLGEPVETAAAFVRGYYDRPPPAIPIPEGQEGK